MRPSSHATALPAAPQPARAPLSILRTETVLTRFPIHQLSTGHDVPIRLTRTTAQGDLVLRWAVTYNAYYGPPRHLAYKLDTIVIQQILDTLPRPLPRELPLGSLRAIGARLDLPVSGRQHAHLKRALHQNASAYIVAYLRYRDRDGFVRTLNTGFTRYSVVLTGETLPNGTLADGVYLLLSAPYLEVLNHAPVRPLDYGYLKSLTPMAQRFYELVSYHMFAALKYGRPHATLRYAAYCLLATQQRYTDYDQVKKQMYKVHRPHVDAGYLTTVTYDTTTAADGRPDWLLHYTPGPKARTEYAAFMRQPGAEAAARVTLAEADQMDLSTGVTCARPQAVPPPAAPDSRPAGAARRTGDTVARSTARTEASPDTADLAAHEDTAVPVADPLQAQAHALVMAFYQRFHGLDQVTPAPKELAHATALLTTYGAAKAYYLLDVSHQAAQATRYQPQTFGGILSYLPRALATYDTRTAPGSTATDAAPDATRMQRWQEQYLLWRQQAIGRLREAVPPDALAAMEAPIRARLVADGIPGCALDLAVRVAVDEALEAQAVLPPFDVWRQGQET
jgi:hypothetical protein